VAGTSIVQPVNIAVRKRRVLCCPWRVNNSLAANCPRRASATRPRTKCPTAQLPSNSSPPDIDELNRLEAERRAALEAQSEPPPRLTDDELELLFEKCPALRRVNDYIDKALVSTPGLDPDSTEAFTWASRMLEPWRPPYLLVGVLSYALFFLLRRFIAVVRIRYLPAQVALALVGVDLVATAALAGVFATLLLLWAMVKESDHSDAQRRLSLTFSLTSSLLPAASALGACGFELAGLYVGAVARLVVLPLTMWMWSDLSQEIYVMRIIYDKPVAYAFSMWRLLTTVFVCLFGGILRIVALANRSELRLRELFMSRALDLRLKIFQRFPVALSLFGDPGGLAFLAGIVVMISFFYGVYVLMFVCDFMQICMHRRTSSLFSNTMISRGIYMPNELEERESLLNTGPAGVKPHFPMQTMMLREGPALFGVGHGIVVDDMSPLLELMGEEEGMMERKGMSRWNPPRNELIPLSAYMTPEKRSRNFLRTWARPMEDPDSTSFEDFFEGVDDEQEYEYDPNSENWVFARQSKWHADNDENGTDTTADAATEAVDESNGCESDPAEFPDLRNPDVGTVV
jgi:Protein of unknown function (DUF3177)